jgi:hypothetical protein
VQKGNETYSTGVILILLLYWGTPLLVQEQPSDGCPPPAGGGAGEWLYPQWCAAVIWLVMDELRHGPSTF